MLSPRVTVMRRMYRLHMALPISVWSESAVGMRCAPIRRGRAKGVALV